MTTTRSPSRSSFTNLLGSSLLAAALIGLAAMEANSAEVPSFTTDISVDDIMASIVMPSADILWTAVTVESTTEGIVETVPETDEDWQKVRDGAVALAAATNLLLIEQLPINNMPPAESPPGELAPAAIAALRNDNQQAWAAHVTLLHTVAMQALDAVDKRDTEELTNVGGDLDAACESCHLQFWYPEG
ncbi:MAG TPA: hypothetical protein VNR18_01480 [Hyphomicrobiales bacterium]|nr:hypothetical protein [Hyphomicrobiales bacterium]